MAKETVKPTTVATGIIKYETPNGKTRFKATATYHDPNGSKRTKSKAFERKSDAIAWKRSMDEKKANGTTFWADNQLVHVVFGRWVDTFIDGHGHREAATVLTYRETQRMLQQMWPTLTMKHANRQQIQLLFDKLIDRNLTQSTIRKYKTHMGFFFRQLTNSGAFERSPFYDIEIGHAKNKGKAADLKVLTFDEYKRLLDYFESMPINESSAYDMVLWTQATTALRSGESEDLKVDDLDEINKTVRVDSSYSRVIGASKSPKTQNSYRTVPYVDAWKRAVDQTLAVQRRMMMRYGWRNTEQRLFLTRNGQPVDNSMLNYRLHQLQDMIGVPKERQISSHGLRHQVISLLLSKRRGPGLTIMEVARLAGDSPATIETTYAHVLAEDSKDSQTDAAAFMNAL